MDTMTRLPVRDTVSASNHVQVRGFSSSMCFYGPDLTYVHHTGFGTFAEEAAPGLVELFHNAGIYSGLVVDLACGSGIWPAHLLRAGYSVVHRVRTFDRTDLEESLTRSGFTVAVTRSYGTLDLPPRRLAFIAQKQRA
jgi:hypothetical protein